MTPRGRLRARAFSPPGSGTGCIADLANLTWLDLDSNQLSGPVPPDLGNLRHLTGLLLQMNTLGGPLPSVLGKPDRVENPPPPQQ